MNADLSNEEIRGLPKDKCPHYFLYHYLPLGTERVGFIGEGGILLEDPLSEEKFQVGHRIENYFPFRRTWEIVKSEIYLGNEENICSGVIICWCKEVL